MKRLEKRKRHMEVKDKFARGMNRLLRQLLLSRRTPRGKWCTKCKAALLCTTKGMPPEVSRCPKCNTRFAIFHPQRNITWATPGVQRCPDRSARKQLDCPVCRGKMDRN